MTATSTYETTPFLTARPLVPLDPNVREALTVTRVVVFAIIVSLIWKLSYFIQAARIYRLVPFEDAFFPYLLQSTFVSSAAYMIALASLMLMLVARSPIWLVAASCLAVFGLGILCIHQQAYNDVTFLTCWWSTLWCLWMYTRIGEAVDSLLPRAAFLTHLILSVIFLGGAVGKMTPGYWSGEVLYEIYFSGRDYWVFNLLRDQFDEAALRNISCWYSRLVTSTELLCAFLWLMPRRLASWLAIAVLLNIALMSNTFLFSVLTCLLGLALVGLHTPKTKTDRSPFGERPV